MSVYRIFEKLGKSNDSEIATACLAGFKLAFIPLATASDRKATREQKEYAIFRDILTEMIALSGYLGITKLVKKNASAPMCCAYYKKKAKLIRNGKISIAKDILDEADLTLLEQTDRKAVKSFKNVGFDSLHGILGRQDLGGKATAEQIQRVKAVEDVVKKIEPFMPQQENVKGFKNTVKKLFSATQEIQRPQELFTNTKVAVSGACVYILALTIIPMVCNMVISPVMRKYKEIRSGQKLEGTKKLDINSDSEPLKVRNPIKRITEKMHINPYQKTTTDVGKMRIGN